MRAAYLITISLACSSSAPPVTPPTASAAPVTDIQTLLDTARIALEPRTSGPDCIADVESQCAEACRQGQGPTVGVACALAADALRAAGDDAGAIEHYLSACGHGDPEGCAEVALLKLDGKIALAGPISCADCQQSWRLEAHPYLLLDRAA